MSFIKLQEALGISPAQLNRDLAYMRERLNAPIDYDRDANGYRFGKPAAGPRYGLAGLWFSAAEIHALLTMQHLLENLQPGLLAPHVKPLLARFAAILGSADHSQEEVVRRVRVLHQAARELKHVISPQRLVHYRDNWYLDAWCHMRKDLRSFAVDAIRAAEPLDERALGRLAGMAPEADGRVRQGRQLLPLAALRGRSRTGDGHPQVRARRRSAGTRGTARARCRATQRGGKAVPPGKSGSEPD